MWQGRVGGVYFIKPAQGVLCTERRGEGSQAGAGVQPVRDTRGQNKRGVQTQGTTGLRRGGERICETNLTAFSSPFISKIGVLNCVFVGGCAVDI